VPKKDKKPKLVKPVKVRDLTEAEADKLGNLSGQRQLLEIQYRQITDRLNAAMAAITSEVEGGFLQSDEAGKPGLYKRG